ncbi:hypothetical protein GCM10010168_85900 [Actinoplanes ianthinogenes]|uniref:DUF11 domain-containing protein n=1 Tax=Actinoplanes ianthinogenes TaxID=122358 RepID=A0ABN6CK07_9ACTN|nr:hypothetical protein [Actinoplanes ianthinogenes]BCJ45321.1 hypothetical protein Aiant_59780 [Actinoplanes ianthinogenes]GGR53765.1 hypothetical protein GCM10010168_85900 [Actinoplanes ianthinogenes]
MQLKELSGDLVFTASVPPTAAGTPIELPVIALPFGLTITEIKWIPGAAITANGTNFFTLTFRNRGSGAGVVVPATRSYASGNSASTTPENLTLSSTATDLQTVAGDVLTAHFTHSGAGLAIPSGLVQVKVRLR